MIADTDVDASLQYILETASASAQARADRVTLEHGLKRIKALAMKEHSQLPVTAQEREAYASPQYQTALEGLNRAVYEDERHRALRDAHSSRIDAWRTLEASRRSVRL